MKKQLHFTVAGLAGLGLSMLLIAPGAMNSRAADADSAAAPNTLTTAEKQAGWTLLWDGKTATGWRMPKSEKFPWKTWSMTNGILEVGTTGNAESQAGGDIITTKRFANFELQVDFRTTEGCNSGIKIFVQPDLKPINPKTGKQDTVGSCIGLEFQILDDERHPDAKLGHDGNRTIGSFYDVLPAAKDKVVMPIGEWNHARIVSKGNHVEFWLNGKMTVQFERGSEAFRQAIQQSKFKNIQGFGEWPDGHILLQEHGSKVDFRNVKIREL